MSPVADKSAQSTTGLKILAVLMAIALWGFVGVSQRVGLNFPAHRRLSVEIEVKHPPPFEHIHLVPAFADVVVEGPAPAVDRLTEGDIEAYVDLGYTAPRQDRAPVKVVVPDTLKYQVTPGVVTLVPVPLR